VNNLILIVFNLFLQIYIHWISWDHSWHCPRSPPSSWSISFRRTQETLRVHDCTGQLREFWFTHINTHSLDTSPPALVLHWKVDFSYLMFRSQDISLENVSSMYELSEAFNARSLRHTCILFILEHFDKLSGKPGYVSDPSTMCTGYLNK